MSGEGMMMMRNKQVVLKRYVEGLPKESDFEVKISSIQSEIPQGTKAVLVKNLYLACDPYLRHQMSQDDHSDNIDLLVPFKLGSVMEGFGVCNVLKSSDPAFKEGDYVWGVTGWEEYSLIHNPTTSILFKIIDQPDVPLSYYTGILGMVGLTAYVGIFNVCRPKEGEVVYVSTAAGGTGMIAGQFAKMLGAYVVGSTSSNEKVDILLNKLGFDDAFNYKQESNFAAALKRCCPKGIDVYFDNVGGPMLDEVIGHMNLHGRIGICGMISQYSLEEPDGIRNLFQVITKRLRVEGFAEIDNWHLVPTYTKWVLEKLKEKKLVYIEDISNGLDNAPSALVSIFNGKNIGKKVVSVQES